MRPLSTSAIALLAIALTLGIAGGQAAPTDPGRKVTERIRIVHVRASQVVAALGATVPHDVSGAHAASSSVPKGVEGIVADDGEQVVVARGSAQAIAELKQIVSLLDVAPTAIQLNMRVLRSDMVRGSRRTTVRVIAAPVIKTTNNSVATMQIRGGEISPEIEVLPRLNGDGTFTIQARLTVASAGQAGDGAAGPTVRTVSGACRVPARKRSVVLCILDGPDRGARPGKRGLPSPTDQPGFYLELAPTVAR